MSTDPSTTTFLRPRWDSLARHPPVAALVATAVAMVLYLGSQVLGFDAEVFDTPVNGPAHFFGTLIAWWTWVPVAGILLLEWWAPAEEPVPSRRIGVVADLGWTVLQIVIWTPVVIVILRGMSAVFEGPLSSFKIDLSGVAPNLALLAFGFALGDFLRWYVHLAFHRYPRLWRFHQVHHTQNRMSMWTDFRSHPLEVIAREMVVALPFFVLGGTYSAPVGWLGFAYAWYSVFYHGNIAWNMGPLRWIVVTPQSHRVHHSVDPEHFDSNFGNVFSIWDRMFGTMHGDDIVLPPTGLDEEVPMESDLTPSGQARAYVDQLAYPFHRVDEPG